MDQVIYTVVLSLFSSYLFYLLLRFRVSSIKADIRALQEEEDFLERINKGNTALIRAGLKFISLFFCIAFLASFIFTLPLFVSFPTSFVQYLYAVGSSLLLGGAVFSFYFLRALLRLRNLKITKEVFQTKRENLQSKIHN